MPQGIRSFVPLHSLPVLYSIFFFLHILTQKVDLPLVHLNLKRLLSYQKLGIVGVKPRDYGCMAMRLQGSYDGKGSICLSIDTPETNLSPSANKFESSLVDVNRRY